MSSSRPAPDARSSTWILYTGGDTRAWDVGCDTRLVPSVREALNMMFQGDAGAGRGVPGEDVGVLLEIRWREDGAETSRSRLYADGSLLKIEGETTLVHRVLDDERLQRVRAQLERAATEHACPPTAVPAPVDR